MREIDLNGYIDDEVWFGDEITPEDLHESLYSNPITCDCMKYLMASDWTYIIQIATHQGERQGPRKQERETSYAGEIPQIDIRLAVYRKIGCNEPLFQSREKPYIGLQEADLPPVFVPKAYESLRYPNHVMLVSYDYACMPQILSSDILKREKA